MTPWPLVFSMRAIWQNPAYPIGERFPIQWRTAVPIKSKKNPGKSTRGAPVARTNRTPPETALLLIAHGSREQVANDDLHVLTARLRERNAYMMVEPAFLELESPTITEGAERCIQRG